VLTTSAFRNEIKIKVHKIFYLRYGRLDVYASNFCLFMTEIVKFVEMAQK